MLDMVIRARIFLDSVAARAFDRGRDERGQTAAEYLGIIVLVAAIIAAVVGTDIDQDIKNALEAQIQKIIGEG